MTIPNKIESYNQNLINILEIHSSDSNFDVNTDVIKMIIYNEDLSIFLFEIENLMDFVKKYLVSTSVFVSDFIEKTDVSGNQVIKIKTESIFHRIIKLYHDDINDEFKKSITSITNIHKLVSNGVYGITVDFFRYVDDTLKFKSQYFKVKDISPSRLELRIENINDDINTDKDRFKYFKDKTTPTHSYNYFSDDIFLDLKMEINGGLPYRNNYKIVNAYYESFKFIIFKLIEPLESTINVNSNDTSTFVTPYFKIISSHQYLVDIYVASIEQETTFSLTPNFNLTVAKTVKGVSSNHKSFSDITGSLTRNVVEDYLNNPPELPVDYSIYNNFIFYSSARNRLDNFKYKIEQIELNVSMSASLGSASPTDAAKFNNTIQNIVGSFDGYEKYLYYESSSYHSSSFGEFFDSSWPKQGSTKPYVLCSQTSSTLESWYTNQSHTASLYDTNNNNNLKNSLPLYILEAEESNGTYTSYITFINMIGHFFDYIRLYIKNMSNRNINSLQHDKLIPESLSKEMVKIYGFDISDDFNLYDLSKFIMGYDSSGKFITSSLNPITYKNQSNFLRQRILHASPYILKSKGTKESIYSLFNTFGIPREYYTIKEYGGPEQTMSFIDTTLNDNTTLEQYISNFKLKFEGEQCITSSFNSFNSYLETLWAGQKTPDTCEIRFSKTEYRSPGDTETLMESYGSDRIKWSIVITPSESEAGKGNFPATHGNIEFILKHKTNPSLLSQSIIENVPLANGKPWNLLLKRTIPTGSNESKQSFKLFLKQVYADKEVYSISSSLSWSLNSNDSGSYIESYNTPSKLLIGSGSYGGFRGHIDNVKLWVESISDNVFKVHSFAPESRIGNSFSSSYTTLITHYEFNDNKNLQLTRSIYDSNVSTTKNHGTGSGFTGNKFQFELTKNIFFVDDISFNRPLSTKVRIDDTYKITDKMSLSKDSSVVESSFDTMGFDSPRLDIVFSPSNISNNLIMKELPFSLNDILGNGLSYFSGSLAELESFRDMFRRKYQGESINDYINNISKLNDIIFKFSEKIIPSRADFNVGISVENNLLERIMLPNFIPTAPSTQNLNLSASGITVAGFGTVIELNNCLFNYKNSKLDGIIKENIVQNASSKLYADYKSKIVLEPQMLNSNKVDVYSVSNIDINNLIEYNTSVFYRKSNYGNHQCLRDELIYNISNVRKKRNRTLQIDQYYQTYTTTESTTLYETVITSPILPISDFKVNKIFDTGSGLFKNVRNSAMEPSYDSNYNLVYSDNHYKNYRYESVGFDRSHFVGTVNTGPEHTNGASTLDGKSVVEISFTTPNKIIVTSDSVEKPRLTVEGIDLELN